MSYAKGTSVSPEKSQWEIGRLLRNHGAEDILYGEFRDSEGRPNIGVSFSLGYLRIEIRCPVPPRDSKAFTHYEHNSGKLIRRSPEGAAEKHDQAVRERWRALLLTLKAKIEAVEVGISTIETEFLAYVAIPGAGKTIGELLMPRLLEAKAVGNANRILPALPAE